jgi:hypothetical protein
MMRWQRRIFVTLVFATQLLSIAFAQERVISKPEVDEIFSLTRDAWEARVKTYVAPEGWVLRPMATSGATGIAAFDRTTGLGLSTQPLFVDDEPKARPTTLIVSSWFPLGSPLAVSLSKAMRDIERNTKADLGDGYDVSTRLADRLNWRAVEITITKRQLNSLQTSPPQ